MTPLFSLAAATLLAGGSHAFVLLPSTTPVRARGGNLDTTCQPLQATAPSVESIQQREDARAALLDSGGVDKLMSMLEKLRGDPDAAIHEYEEQTAAPPAAVATAVADVAPKKEAEPVKAAAPPPVEAVAAAPVEAAPAASVEAAAAAPVEAAAAAPVEAAAAAPAEAAAPTPPQTRKEKRQKRRRNKKKA